MKRKKYLYWGIALLILIFVITFWILYGSYPDFIKGLISVRDFLAVISFVSVGIVLFRVLQSDNSFLFQFFEEFGNHGSDSEIEVLQKKILNLQKNQISDKPEEIQKMVDQLISDIITQDYIDEKLNQLDNLKIDAKFKQVQTTLNNITNRMLTELGRLRTSASLNLVIGTLSTGIAIYLLSSEVFGAKIVFDDTVKLFSHYIPRLSLIVFIEVFAFFFLRLYRENLENIKFYNNELTNFQSKRTALTTAILFDDLELIKSIAVNFAQTERNFKLKKGESTVEIEKIKTTNESNKILTDFLDKISSKI